MGNLIKNWARTQKVGGGGKKAVLLCLADAAFDNERGKVTITQTLIAETIEFDRRSVIRWIECLESDGLIIRAKSKKADGTNNPNEYQIICPAETFAVNEGEDGDDYTEFVQCLTPGCSTTNLINENYCFDCQKEPSDRQSPSKKNQVTDSHHLSDRQSPIMPENTENQPNQVTDSHIEHSDRVSHITLLEEEELLKDNSLSPRVREEIPKIQFGRKGGILADDLAEGDSAKKIELIQKITGGLKVRLGTPFVLPNEVRWVDSIDFTWLNKFSAERYLKTYDLLERIRKKKRGKWHITPEMIEKNIAQIEKLELEIEELNQNGTTNGQRNFSNTNGKPKSQISDNKPQSGHSESRSDTLARLRANTRN